MFKPEITSVKGRVTYYKIVEEESGAVLGLFEGQSSVCLRICLPKAAAETICAALNAQSTSDNTKDKALS